MDNIEKIFSVIIAVMVGILIWMVTSSIKDHGFIEDNCKETTLVYESGYKVYDCEGVTLK